MKVKFNDWRFLGVEDNGSVKGGPPYVARVIRLGDENGNVTLDLVGEYEKYSIEDDVLRVDDFEVPQNKLAYYTIYLMSKAVPIKIVIDTLRKVEKNAWTAPLQTYGQISRVK